MDSNGLALRNSSKNSPANHLSSLEKNRVELQWKDIRYKTPDGRIILNGLSGSSKSGELTAIMGPSGSGKTSLVNVLSGFNQKRASGQILVNGAKRDMNTFRKLTCYILQDDYVLPRFTVREIITFASQLKIPSTMSEKERKKAVDDCIYGLGLVGQQHQRANTLSGGQRKRLCIAQEIVNNPPLIFLDEPTSGLDSSSCLQCIQLLKTMAENGKNIICTIHQPSSRIYEIFDNLYMLSGGDCIYRGRTQDLFSYLADQGLQCPNYHSPTDFLTDIAIGLYGDSVNNLKNAIKEADDLNDSWCQSDVINGPNKERENYMTSMLSSVTNKVLEISQDSWEDITSTEYATNNFNQFRVLLKRYFLHQLRDPINMNLKFFGSITIGFLLGSLYYDTGNDGTKIFNTIGLLFTFMVFIVITAKIPTVLTFPLQRTIFEREHRNGWYSTKMYYLATTVAEIPYQTVCPTINSFLLYYLSGQPMELYRFSLFAFSSVLIALISESLGLMIGAVANVQNGVYVAIVLTGCSLGLNGCVLPLRMTPVFYRWLSAAVYTRYGIHSMFLNLYTGRPPLDCQKGMCFFKDSEKFLKHQSIDGNLMEHYAILLTFLAVSRIFAYFSLRIKISFAQ